MADNQKKYDSCAVYCNVCRDYVKPVCKLHCDRRQNEKISRPSVLITSSCQYVKKTVKVDARKKPGFEILMTDSESEDEVAPNKNNSQNVSLKGMSWFDICELDDKD